MPTLTWLTREEDIKRAGRAPYRLLEPVPELSYGDPNTGNMLIQGDNLDALKALLPYFAGKVKCIYIDPPYNTRSAFEQYDDSLEHSQWLAMMYPRLELIRQLMRDDGLIWISVDGHEFHYLKVIMDEIFGRSNIIESMVWKKSYGGGSKSKWVVNEHEFILFYAKNAKRIGELWLPPDSKSMKYYKYKDEHYETRGPYRLQPLATTSMDERSNLRYPIYYEGNEIWPEKQWQWSRTRAMTALEQGSLVISRKKGEWSVSYKQYLKDEDGETRGTKPRSVIDGIYTQHGTQESVTMFGLEEKFQFPKPERLISQIIQCSTRPGDIVLDSFAGSGTTIAVAQKLGRVAIGIEIGPHAVSHCAPRIRQVIDGEQGGISKTVGWKGGGGFRFYRLGEPVFDELGRIKPDIKFPALAAHLWFSETGTPIDGIGKSPVLGIHQGAAICLLYNGILQDRTINGGNVLTGALLAKLKKAANGAERYVVYGAACRLGADRLKAEAVTFKQTPYEIRAR